MGAKGRLRPDEAERRKDERDLLILHAMLYPPHGRGMSAGEAAKWVNQEFEDLGEVTRNICRGQLDRIVNADRKAHA